MARVLTLLHRCHPYGVCLWCYRCFLRSIPSPKIVGARSPRPDENRADASAPISLQGGRSLNSGRGNPAPTEPRRESYLKILLHTPDRDVTPTGFYGAGTYIATQIPHIRGSVMVLSDFLHRFHPYEVLWRGYLHCYTDDTHTWLKLDPTHLSNWQLTAILAHR